MMRIGTLAERAGVSTRMLRYYEEKGLLEPERLANGYRRYAAENVRTVQRIRQLLAAGLNTDMVREVLPCSVDDGEVIAPACLDLVTEFERERERISQRIVELQDTRSLLDTLILAGRKMAGSGATTTGTGP